MCPDDQDCFQTGALVDLFVKHWGEGLKWVNKYDGGPHEANFLPSYSTSTGEQNAAYMFTADSSWTKVVSDEGTVVYGYNGVLNLDDETAMALCESITMVEMSGSEFLGAERC